MATLDTVVAVYEDANSARTDWSRLEAAAAGKRLEIADGALVENQQGEAVVVQRESHHGWGKGAVVGAVIGLVFPPSLLGSAAVGAGVGAVSERMTRSLGRGKIEDLGETLSSGSAAIILVCPASSTNTVSNTVTGARSTMTLPSLSDEEIRAVMDSGRYVWGRFSPGKA